MKIMNLIWRDRRSLEYGESRVRKNSLLRLARCPVLAGHVTVVGGWSSPGKTIASVVCAHTVESVAAGKPSFKVINA